MDIDDAPSSDSSSVPMAMRKHLFPFRTQKLSSSAAIILRKRETSTVPNYIKALRKEGFYLGEVYSEENFFDILK